MLRVHVTEGITFLENNTHQLQVFGLISLIITLGNLVLRSFHQARKVVAGNFQFARKITLLCKVGEIDVSARNQTNGECALDSSQKSESLAWKCIESC